MTAPRWEHFEHEADIGVRGFGDTLTEAFRQVALALTGIITEPDDINPQTCIHVNCETTDREVLLVDWLNEIIYQMAVNKILFSRFDIDIAGDRLSGKICGEAVDRQRHQPAVEIKGATFTELKVYQQNGEWVAQCVVDV